MAVSTPDHSRLSRRALLRGSFREPSPLRPPWALDESRFTDACTGCGDCIAACPEQVLARAGGGLPRFDPGRSECTFCGDCVAACEAGAFDPGLSPPWRVRASVGDACLPANGVVCSSCREVCPESAIRVPPGARGAATVDADRCTGCGACVGICPTGAIALSHAPLEEAA